MPGRTWRREDVDLHQVWTEDTPGKDEPLFYRVVAIIESPVVVLVPLDSRDGEEREYHVIDSPAFAKWNRIDWVRPG